MKKVILLIFVIFIVTNLFASNLIQNYSFEDGFNNWTEIGTESYITNSTAQEHTGTHSCRFVNPTADFSGRGIKSDNVAVTAGNVYDLWGWFYVSKDSDPSSITDTDIRLRVFWLKSDQSTPCDPASNPNQLGWSLSSFNAWTKNEFNSITAPSEAAYAYVLVECKETGGDDNDVFIDDIQFGPTGTLPVTLSTFTAQYLNSKPTLYWQTQSEVDNMGWFIYRNTAEDFTTAEKITGMIEGHGTTTEPQSYIYEDAEELQIEQTYYYWLESVDYSGTLHHYDRVAQVTIPHPNDPGQNVTPPIAYDITADPNPFSYTTNISFVMDQPSLVDVAIYNVKGQLVKSFNSVMSSQENETVAFSWNGKNDAGKSLSNGVYLYLVKVNGKDYATKQLILMK